MREKPWKSPSQELTAVRPRELTAVLYAHERCVDFMVDFRRCRAVSVVRVWCDVSGLCGSVCCRVGRGVCRVLVLLDRPCPCPKSTYANWGTRECDTRPYTAVVSAVTVRIYVGSSQ